MANSDMRDKTIKERQEWLSLTILIGICIYITDSYTIATTKYASTPCFSRCHHTKQQSKKNRIGIIGNDMRIKRIMGKFLKSARRNNWQNFKHNYAPVYKRCVCMNHHFCKVHALLYRSRIIDSHIHSYPDNGWSEDTSVSTLSSTDKITCTNF